MSGRRAFLTNSGLSIINQVLLSGLNFLVGLCIIRLGTKETYGLYSQLFAGGIFAVAVLDSLLGTPLTTLAPSMPTVLRQHVMRQLHRCQQLAAGGLAIVLGVAVSGLLIWHDAHADPWLLGAVFAFFVFTSAVREFQRTLWFIESEVFRVFRMDAIYVLLACFGGLVLIWLEDVNVVAALLILALANVIAFRPHPPAAADENTENLPTMQATLLEMWSKGKWALPGALIGLAGNYSFLYLSSAMIGLTAAADLNAARLLLVPVSLLVVAWSRVARPQASRLIQAQDWPALNKLALRSLGGIEFLAIAYISVLIFALPWLQSHVLGEKYQTITSLVWAWSAYFLINSARYIASSWLVSLGKFRFLFFQGFLEFLLMLVLAWAFMSSQGAIGAIVALCCVEFIDLLISWFLVFRLRRLRGEEHDTPR